MGVSVYGFLNACSDLYEPLLQQLRIDDALDEPSLDEVYESEAPDAELTAPKIVAPTRPSLAF